jgi:hypothetical protein
MEGKDGVIHQDGQNPRTFSLNIFVKRNVVLARLLFLLISDHLQIDFRYHQLNHQPSLSLLIRVGN